MPEKNEQKPSGVAEMTPDMVVSMVIGGVNLLQVVPRERLRAAAQTVKTLGGVNDKVARVLEHTLDFLAKVDTDVADIVDATTKPRDRTT